MKLISCVFEIDPKALAENHCIACIPGIPGLWEKCFAKTNVEKKKD